MFISGAPVGMEATAYDNDEKRQIASLKLALAAEHERADQAEAKLQQVLARASANDMKILLVMKQHNAMVDRHNEIVRLMWPHVDEKLLQTKIPEQNTTT
jgi:hypothetical protein